jgi:hypothetical protein
MLALPTGVFAQSTKGPTVFSPSAQVGTVNLSSGRARLLQREASAPIKGCSPTNGSPRLGHGRDGPRGACVDGAQGWDVHAARKDGAAGRWPGVHLGGARGRSPESTPVAAAPELERVRIG